MTQDNYVAIYVHLIWSTKNLENILYKDVRYKLFEHIHKTCLLKGIKLLIVNGVENHVHCLISLLPTQTISEIVKQIKGESSHWFNEEFPDYFQKLVWQNGYGAISVSPQNRKRVYEYIYRQEEHHRDKPFDDELILFQKFIDN